MKKTDEFSIFMTKGGRDTMEDTVIIYLCIIPKKIQENINHPKPYNSQFFITA